MLGKQCEVPDETSFIKLCCADSQMWNLPCRLRPLPTNVQTPRGIHFPGISHMCASEEGWGSKWQRGHCMGHLWCPALLPPSPHLPPEDAAVIMCTRGLTAPGLCCAPLVTFPKVNYLHASLPSAALLSWGTQAKTVAFLPCPHQLS